MPPPLRPELERAALALWATPVHANSMVESTADDHLIAYTHYPLDGGAMLLLLIVVARSKFFRLRRAMTCAALFTEKHIHSLHLLGARPSPVTLLMVCGLQHVMES